MIIMSDNFYRNNRAANRLAEYSHNFILCAQLVHTWFFGLKFGHLAYCLWSFACRLVYCIISPLREGALGKQLGLALVEARFMVL